METTRSEAIKKLVDDATKSVTFETLLKDYKEELTEHFEELSDEKLFKLVDALNNGLSNYEQPETIDNFKRQLELYTAISKANSMEEVFILRNNSGLYKEPPSERVKQKTLEEFKSLANESIETIKKMLGENNGNN